MLALNCGNTFSAAPQTLSAIAVTVILPPASSALGAKRARSCSSSVMSARSCCVTWGIVFQDSERCSAVLRRTPRMETRSILPHFAKSGSCGWAKCPARGAVWTAVIAEQSFRVHLDVVVADAPAGAAAFDFVD